MHWLKCTSIVGIGTSRFVLLQRGFLYSVGGFNVGIIYSGFRRVQNRIIQYCSS